MYKDEKKAIMSTNQGAKCFEELRIWNEARILVNSVYDKMAGIKDFSFRDQIQRASISVMNNISEGFERGSSADFARMLDIAKGSSGEVRSMLYLSEDRNYLDAKTAVDLRSRYTILSASISSLIKHLRSNK